MDKKTQTINTYNHNAKALAVKFDAMGARIQDVERAFSYLNKAQSSVLEIGCGNGRDAKEILKYTSHYIGIDVSEELIKMARESEPDAHFEIADIENYTFPEHVDLIIAFASLLHSDKENLQVILDKAHEALHEHGIFYISLKYGDYHEEILVDEFGTRCYYFYTPEIIMAMAKDRYKVEYQNIQDINGQKWFVIVLRKV